MVSAAINTLIFDLDNTLVNRNLAMRKTMEYWLQLHPHHHCPLELIMEQDAGGYTDRVVFCNWLLETFGAQTSGINDPAALLLFIQQTMVTYLAPEPGVLQLLEKLRVHFLLVLASNGSGQVQRAKLQQSRLLTYFQPKHIFISGEMGLAKPDAAFYTVILESLAIHPHQAMMIGDDLINDIAAAQQCGLFTCRVPGDNRPGHTVTPDLNIHHITALDQWLKC